MYTVYSPHSDLSVGIPYSPSQMVDINKSISSSPGITNTNGSVTGKTSALMSMLTASASGSAPGSASKDSDANLGSVTGKTSALLSMLSSKEIEPASAFLQSQNKLKPVSMSSVFQKGPDETNSSSKLRTASPLDSTPLHVNSNASTSNTNTTLELKNHLNLIQEDKQMASKKKSSGDSIMSDENTKVFVESIIRDQVINYIHTYNHKNF